MSYAEGADPLHICPYTIDISNPVVSMDAGYEEPIDTVSPFESLQVCFLAAKAQLAIDITVTGPNGEVAIDSWDPSYLSFDELYPGFIFTPGSDALAGPYTVDAQQAGESWSHTIKVVPPAGPTIGLSEPPYPPYTIDLGTELDSTPPTFPVRVVGTGYQDTSAHYLHLYLEEEVGYSRHFASHPLPAVDADGGWSVVLSAGSSTQGCMIGFTAAADVPLEQQAQVELLESNGYIRFCV